MYFHLIEAIAFHQKGITYGMEYFIFPADLNPRIFSNDLDLNSQVFLNNLYLSPDLCLTRINAKI